MNLHSVKSRRKAAFLLALVATASGRTASADQETDRLRAENQHLKAQLQALQQSCTAIPAAASSPAAVNAPAAAPVAGVAPPAALVPPPASAPVPPPPTVASAPAVSTSPVQPAAGSAPANVAATTAPAAVVPKGYKLVPVNAPDYVDPLAPPYNRTGCSRDLFSGPPQAKWNDAENWGELSRGASMSDVEAVLGKEHFDVSNHARVEWQYGKCGDMVSGRVQFQDGKVISWKVPDL